MQIYPNNKIAYICTIYNPVKRKTNICLTRPLFPEAMLVVIIVPFVFLFFSDKVTFPLFCIWQVPGWRVYSFLSRKLLDIEIKFETHQYFLEYVTEVILIVFLHKPFIWELSMTDNFYSLSDWLLFLCVYCHSSLCFTKGTFTRVSYPLCFTPTSWK